MAWSPADIPDQTGRTFVVTGASSGLGRATTRALVGAGAHVVMAVRDLAKGGRAMREVDGGAGLRELDLTDLSSVRRFAESFDEPVHALVNNAGVMAVPRGRTRDGFETQLGTNHLGHFALTLLLLPRITDRVVTVSSGGHRIGGLDLTDLGWERRRYSPWLAYGASKLANLLFTLELQRRLDAAGSRVRALAAHPGVAATDLGRQVANPVQRLLGGLLTPLLTQSEELGARSQLFAATQDLPGASYVGPDGPMESRGRPTLVGRSAAASDLDLAARLWAESERLTGVSWPSEPPTGAPAQG